MTGLLKADFKRVFKDKLLIVMGILAVVFALITPLLYLALFSGMGATEAEMEMISGALSLYGRDLFFSSFSIGNNLGLIAPVLLAIILRKDFSYGTIRNKIIAGKSRSAIFMSLFITCSVVLISVILLHAFITLGFSLLFFDYQPGPFEFSDIGYFLGSLALELLPLLFVAALLSWLCASMKNVGVVVVLFVAFSFILTLAGSIIAIIIQTLEIIGGSETTLSVLRFVDRINVSRSVAYIGLGSSYSLEDILYLTIPAITGILGFVGLGLMKFNKRDIK